MKDQLQFFPDIFLRSPLYSFEDYAPGKLGETLKTDIFKQALLLASPGFYSTIALKDFDADRLSSRETHTLLKYYNRMSFRPTPFGAFATFTLTGWSEDEVLLLKGIDAVTLYRLPDWQRLQENDTSKAAFGEDTLLRLNPTVYQVGNSYRFVRSAPGSDGRLQFFLTAIEAEPLTRRLFILFSAGHRTGAELTGLITEATGCSTADATDFATFLLGEQFLITPGPAPLLLPAGTQDRFLRRMQLGEPSALLPEQIPLAAETPYYAAAERPVRRGGISIKTQAALRDALDALARLAPVTQSLTLRQFARAFKARFEQQRVPLLRALDPDLGVAYGNISGVADTGWLSGVAFPEKKEAEAEVPWTAVHRFFLDRWITDRKRGVHDPVRITQEHIEQLAGKKTGNTVPATFFVAFRFAGDQLVIDHAGGATGTALIGRFSVFSQSVADLCSRITALEEQQHPDLIFADTEQQADHHADNVNRRVAAYRYAIPVNIFSAIPEDRLLQLNDLTVSVSGEEVILESVSLGKRVVPRLSSAFNYQRSELGLTRFFGDLQYQGLQSSLALDLERLFPGLDFYPRVEFGQTILCTARWHIDGETIAGPFR